MTSKARKIKNIKDTAVPVVQIPKEIIESSKCEPIAETLIIFNNATKEEQQIDIIRSLSKLTNSTPVENSKAVVFILSYLFLTTKSRQAIKRSISRIFANASNASEISNELSMQLLHLIRSINVETESNLINDIISSINDCFENCAPAANSVDLVLDNVFEFLVNNLNVFVDKLECPNEKLLEYIHTTTQALINVFPRMSSDSTASEHLPKIFSCCSRAINNNSICFDTKNNCGILLAIASSFLKEDGYVDLVHSCLLLNFEEPSSEESRDSAHINISCILSGLLNTVPAKQLCQYNEDFGVSIMNIICNKLLELSKSVTKSPAIIINMNRALLIASGFMYSLPAQELDDLLIAFLDHCYINLEHYIDTVRHISKTIFSNLVKLAVANQMEGNMNPLDQILSTVFAMSHLRTARYTILGLLASEIGVCALLERSPSLIDDLFVKIEDIVLSTYVITCSETLMKCHLKEISEETWINTWIIPLTKKLQQCDTIENENQFQDMLTCAIKLKPSVISKILSKLSTDHEEHLLSVMKSCLVARKIGAKIEENVDSGKWRDLIEYSVLELAMCHENKEIRVTSLALISESLKSTEVFSKNELDFVMNFLRVNICTQLPAMRQRILSLMRKILMRFNESYYALVRDWSRLERSPKDSINVLNNKACRESYKNFILSLHNFLLDNIFPGANVSRRTISLEVLTMMQPVLENVLKKEGIPEKECWTDEKVDSLFLGLLDSYETNKKLAVFLLASCPRKISELNHFNDIEEYVKRSLNMAASVRPTETISAPYLLEHLLTKIDKDEKYNEYEIIRLLLDQLKCQLAIAKQSLWKAAESAPMQGTLFCIRHLLERYKNSCNQNYNWKDLISELLETCIEVTKVVGTVVNNASPEGHFPKEDSTETSKEKPDDLGNVTPQMLLVCCWRSVKEVSLLLGDIAINSSLKTRKEPVLLTEEQMTRIGEHFITLLAELKHRGAFEQAHVGFTKLCTCLWNSSSENLRHLPEIWLQDIFNAIQGKPTSFKNDLCATRRSAGVPFMVQALVTTELQTGQDTHFHQCMQTLLNLAATEDEDIKTRIHAKNILRALYKHTQLGEVVTPYISIGLRFAIHALKAKEYAERNSATQLFASLMTRIFGVQKIRDEEFLNIKNRMIARVFFTRFEYMYIFIFAQLNEILRKTFNVDDETALLSILVVLVRLYSAGPDDEESNKYLHSFMPYIRKCCALPNFKIRKQAAFVMSEIIPAYDRSEYLLELFHDLSNRSIKNENFIHGHLMQISYFQKSANPDEMYVIIKGTFRVTHLLNWKRSALTVDQYLAIILKILDNYESNSEDILPHLEHLLQLIRTYSKYVEANIRIGRSKYEYSAAHLELRILQLLYPDDISQICNRLFENLYQVDTDASIFTLNFITYLYSDKTETTLKDDFGIVDPEQLFADSLSKSYRQKLVEYLNDHWREIILKFNEFLDKNAFLAGKAFEMLSNFPNALLEISKCTGTAAIQYYMNYSESGPQPTEYARIASVRTLLRASPNLDLKCIGETFCDTLEKYTRMSSSAICRYCVASILTENHRLLCAASTPFEVSQLSTLWVAVMQLLEDSEELIRNKMSTLVTKLNIKKDNVIAEKAKEDLLSCSIKEIRSISSRKCILFLLELALISRDSADEEDLDGPVYEQGEVNTYIECMYLNKLSAQSLKMFFECENNVSNILKEVESILLETETCFEIQEFLNTIKEIQSESINAEDCLKFVQAKYSAKKEISRTPLELKLVYNIRNIFKNLLCSA